MSVGLDVPDITLTLNGLDGQGFTDSGLPRFTETVNDYAKLLLHRSVQYGEADRAEGLPREITHDHVRAAAYSIAKSYGKTKVPGWAVPVQIAEYICTAIAGVGAGHLDKGIGILGFGVALAAAVILIVIRLVAAKGE
jgi:hypothetical protein